MIVESNEIKGVRDLTLHACPLGVRFWDPVLQSVVVDGLKVSAYPAGNPRLRVDAISNPSGVFVFHGLPGLRPFELRQGEKQENPWKNIDPWSSPSSISYKRFCIEITDGTGRFLPFLLRVAVPNKNILSWNRCAPGSPPDMENGFVPLFSAPTRSAPPSYAVLRADLWDQAERRPASYALLKASFEGTHLAQGIADAKGRISLIFPYPEPARYQYGSPGGSPPGMGVIIPLREQKWQIDLQAFYKPDFTSDENPIDIPDLETICNQPPATLWQKKTAGNGMVSVSVKFGEEKILKTEDGSKSLSEFYITSAVSPP